MKKRQPRYKKLFSQYQRYLRKLSRIDQGLGKSQKREWLIKRITKLRAQLHYYRDASKMWRRSLAAGATLALVTPVIHAQSQQYIAENPNPVAAFSIDADAHPVFVDFDGDGDDDFFLAGEATDSATAQADALHYYRNDDNSYTKAAGPFPADLSAGDLIAEDDQLEVNPAFIDFDEDGDLDAFIGFGSGGIRYYRNDDGVMTHSPTDNPFTADVDSAFVANSLSPALGDVDGDGDIDLMLGRGGTTTYYENSDTGFAERQSYNGAFFLTSNASPTLSDFDGDGDLDLIIGNKYGQVDYYEYNEGEFTRDEDHPLNQINVGAYIHPGVTDFDQDGDLDLIIGSTDGGLSYFSNEEGDVLRAASNALGITINGSESRPAFFDYDGDNDPDLFVGTELNEILLWKNEGGTFAADTVSNPFHGIEFDGDAAPSFADIDADGDMDLIVSYYGNSSSPDIFTADGGTFTQITDTLQNPLFDLTTSDGQAWAFHDIDNDGDLDAIMGNKSGDIQFFDNDGGAFTRNVDHPMEDIDVDGYAVPTFADYDSDGDMDLLVGNEDGIVSVFELDAGVPTEVAAIEADGWTARAESAPAVADVDGDGTMDIIVGSQSGEIFFLKNVTASTGTEDLVDLSEKMQVYPNPATDIIQVEADWNSGKAELMLRDVNGTLLVQREVFGNMHSIQIADLPKGVYSVEVRTAESRAIQNVVVK